VGSCHMVIFFSSGNFSYFLEGVRILKELLTLEFLEGKRTYFSGYGLMAFAVLGYLLGQLDLNMAIIAFLNGAGLAGLRAATK